MDASNNREHPETKSGRLLAVLATAFFVIAAVAVLWMLLASAHHATAGGADVSVASEPAVLLT